MKYLIGIDEAGRGPLAGPVAVGVVMVPIDFDFSVVEGVRDSKQMTHLGRALWHSRMHAMHEAGTIRYAVAFSSALTIDTKGIVPAIRSALARALAEMNADSAECEVRLDGNLKAPAYFKNQSTIIHGDDLEPVISMASVMAKVERDRIMTDVAAKYPQYGFERHKGYGTTDHCDAIRKHGLSKIHRTTFCTRVLLGGAPEAVEAISLQSEGISV